VALRSAFFCDESGAGKHLELRVISVEMMFDIRIGFEGGERSGIHNKKLEDQEQSFEEHRD